MKGLQLGSTAHANILAGGSAALTIPSRSDGASARSCHVSWVTSIGAPPSVSVDSVIVAVYSDGNTTPEETLLPYEEPMILYTGGCDRIEFNNFTSGTIQVFVNAMDHE